MRLACIWDFDGTLMDTYPVMTQAMQEALQEMGITLTDQEVWSMLKASLGICERTVSERFQVDKKHLDRAFRAHERTLMDRFVPVAGIPEVLAKTSDLGASHFLLTHRDHVAVDVLKQTGLWGYFMDKVTDEDGYPRKPNPEGLLSLVTRHHLERSHTVMIGDRPLDVQAGRNAGVHTILLDTENRFAGETCDAIVSSAMAMMPQLETWMKMA